MVDSPHKEGGKAEGLALPPPPPRRVEIYPDGSCPLNQRHHQSPVSTGWGFAAVVEGTSVAMAELYGPVTLPSSPPIMRKFSLGADRGTNSTGEVTAIAEGCLWVRDFLDGGMSSEGAPRTP